MLNRGVRILAITSIPIISAAALIPLLATGASASTAAATVADVSPGHAAVAADTAVRTVSAPSLALRDTPAEEEWLFAGNFETWEGCAAAGAAYYASGEALAFYCEEESNPVTGVYGYLLWILANVET
jgi:hypothetical protein